MSTIGDQKLNTLDSLPREKSNPKIILVNRYSPPTSIYRLTQDLRSVLGKEASVINLRYNPREPKIDGSSVSFRARFQVLPQLNYLFRNIAFSNARKYIESLSRNEGHLIVHYTSQFSGVLNMDMVTNIISIHDSPYYINNSSFIEKHYLTWLYNSLKMQKYIITNTNQLKNELIDFGFEGEIRTIYHPYSSIFQHLAIKKDTLRKKLGLPNDRKLVLSISTDSARKNLPMVKRVLDKLGNGFKLVRVGTSLGSSITFRDIDDKTLNELYNACDVLLLPSLYEGFGFPIIEAFATGLPVVASDIPTIKEIAGNAAVLCDPRDLDNLKEGIMNTMEYKDDLIRKGIERSSLFSFDRFRNNMLSLYENIEQDTL